MSNIAKQVAQLLVNESFGVIGTSIFISKEPDQPNNCITVFDIGGIPDKSIVIGDVDNERPIFQVRVRNANYFTAHNTIDNIRLAIDKQSKSIPSENVRLAIWSTTLQEDGQSDTKNRVFVDCDFICQRESL